MTIRFVFLLLRHSCYLKRARELVSVCYVYFVTVSDHCFNLSRDIVTYPRLVCSFPTLLFPQHVYSWIELRLGVNKKGPRATFIGREFVLHLLYSGVRSIDRHFGICT